MNNRILLIDAQVFQGNDWNRGMGKYSLEFIRSLQGNAKHDYSKTYLVFSSKMVLSKEASDIIRQAVPGAKRLYLDLESPSEGVSWRKVESQNRQIIDEKVRDLRNSATVDYLILSAFSQYVCPVFPSSARKIVICYDLIPLLFSKHYMQFPTYDNYLERLKVLFNADLIFTISQTTADDVVNYLGIISGKVHNIGGAPISRNYETSAKPAIVLKNRYILLPTGQEFRKNNLIAVEGFAQFCERYNDSTTKLVITSNFTKDAREQLYQISDQIVFTGNVSEKEIEWLYQNAECILFSSSYEGLGLPILEAVEKGKPVVCSDINIFREISDEAFYFVDQNNPASIASGIKRAVKQEGWSERKKLYKAIIHQFSWLETASRAIEVLNNNQSFGLQKPPRKYRIAILCPNPQGYSEIGRVAMLLHPSLADRYEIDYFLEDAPNFHLSRALRPNYLGKLTNTYNAADFDLKSYASYDAVIYHIGNSNYHVNSIKNALYLPGIVIVHDSDIGDVYTGALIDTGAVSKARVKAEELLDRRNRGNKTKYLTSLINAQRAVIVHSAYNKKAIEEISGKVPVVQANLPTAVPRRLRLRSDAGKLNIGIAGNLHSAKGIDIVEKIASMEEITDRCNLFLFGFSALHDEVLIRLMLNKHITLKTDMTDFEFQSLLSKLDLSINYRMDYRGETSASVINAMKYGITPLVRNIGWYAELPDDCAIKVNSIDEVPSAIKSVVSHPQLLRTMGQKCYEYISDSCTYQKYVEIINQLIEQTDDVNYNMRLSKLIKQGITKDAFKNAIINWEPGGLKK
jgi:glycosyltransferase involved in cell wall biosynthesis